MVGAWDRPSEGGLWSGVVFVVCCSFLVVGVVVVVVLVFGCCPCVHVVSFGFVVRCRLLLSLLSAVVCCCLLLSF